MVLVWRRWIGGALIALLAIGLSAMLSEAAGSEVDDAVAYFNRTRFGEAIAVLLIVCRSCRAVA